jgi:hypothetical protein
LVPDVKLKGWWIFMRTRNYLQLLATLQILRKDVSAGPPEGVQPRPQTGVRGSQTKRKWVNRRPRYLWLQNQVKWPQNCLKTEAIYVIRKQKHK